MSIKTLCMRKEKAKSLKKWSELCDVLCLQQNVQKPARSQSSRLSSPCLKAWNTLNKTSNKVSNIYNICRKLYEYDMNYTWVKLCVTYVTTLMRTLLIQILQGLNGGKIGTRVKIKPGKLVIKKGLSNIQINEKKFSIKLVKYHCYHFTNKLQDKRLTEKLRLFCIDNTFSIRKTSGS